MTYHDYYGNRAFLLCTALLPTEATDALGMSFLKLPTEGVTACPGE